MADVFVLLNHTLSGRQRQELAEKGVGGIHLPPEPIKKLWQGIPPDGPLPVHSLESIADWLKETGKTGDFVLIQGEFGATYYVVNSCFRDGFVPIYATSKREYREEAQADGSVIRVHRFKHVQFRRYER